MKNNYNMSKRKHKHRGTKKQKTIIKVFGNMDLFNGFYDEYWPDGTPPVIVNKTIGKKKKNKTTTVVQEKVIPDFAVCPTEPITNL